jgi:hypothetical protein
MSASSNYFLVPELSARDGLFYCEREFWATAMMDRKIMLARIPAMICILY